MGTFKAFPLDEMLRRGSIRDADVAVLRAAFHRKDDISPGEAEALFAINSGCRVQDRAWVEFFVETIVDYVVKRAPPEGYLTAGNAAWLISRISRDGNVDSQTEFKLLLAVLEHARWSPASLVRFAMEQIRRAVVTGDGPLRAGLALPAHMITEAEIEVLRRILYAFGGDGCVPITRAEAEVLFEIDGVLDETAPNLFGWGDLFGKAIVNLILGSSGYAVPPREQALAPSDAAELTGALPARGGARVMLMRSLDGAIGLYHEQSCEERALARLERQRIEIITNEEITEGETSWLLERLGRTGSLTPTKEVLLTYLRRANVKMLPELLVLVQRLAAA